MNRCATVLIVEDHTMIAEYVASVLEGAGYVPVHAATLAQARQHLAAATGIDVCVCDRRLPDGDCVELLPDLGTVPAIVVSAELEHGEHRRLIDLGFVDALRKPCAPERLCAGIAAALGHSGDWNGPGRRSRSDIDDVDPGAGRVPVLDDEQALRMCGGNADVMRRLRRLFAAELPALRERLARLSPGDPDAADQLAAETHKLLASAGWCGAGELTGSCERLRQGLASDSDRNEAHAQLLASLERLQLALTAVAGNPE